MMNIIVEHLETVKWNHFQKVSNNMGDTETNGTTHRFLFDVEKYSTTKSNGCQPESQPMVCQNHMSIRHSYIGSHIVGTRLYCTLSNHS